jgi:hypothetical protein
MVQGGLLKLVTSAAGHPRPPCLAPDCYCTSEQANKTSGVRRREALNSLSDFVKPLRPYCFCSEINNVSTLLPINSGPFNCWLSSC